jgi:Fe-S cluster assembly ATP-binding protein
MGKNGAGKSSLFHAIAGHYSSLTGEIFLNDQPIHRMAVEKIARMGLFLAHQHPVPLPGITITQLLRAALQARLRSGVLFDHMKFYEDMYAAMDFLKIDRSWATRHVNDGFSGGECKRCEALQMLLLQPYYVLLDEIDSGLDADGIATIARVIEKLLNDGVGILAISHRPQWLAPLNPTNVHVLQDGCIKQCGDMHLALRIAEEGFGH